MMKPEHHEALLLLLPVNTQGQAAPLGASLSITVLNELEVKFMKSIKSTSVLLQL